VNQTEISVALRRIVTLLATNLKEDLAAAAGTKKLQVVFREPCNEDDLGSGEFVVARAADAIRSYLAAWPTVGEIERPVGEFGISHSESVTYDSPVPGLDVYSESALTPSGKLDVILRWNREKRVNEIGYVLRCSVRP
jgi:hypothetical protein